MAPANLTAGSDTCGVVCDRIQENRC
jgi:hypothetical protein